MKTFKLNDRMEIVARYEKTRSGFRHRATLLIDGREVDEVTEHYLNRTWESYEFETVINKLIDKTTHISPEIKQELKDKLAGKSHEEIESQFKVTGMVAKLGDVFAKDRVEKNIWKKRMLKAGLGAKGLEFPEGFEKLPEEVKEKRLNKAIGFLTEKKMKKETELPKIKVDMPKPSLKEILRERYLEPRFDTKKSFYKKAKIKEFVGKKVLQSYSTDVAEVRNGKAVVKGLYSPTTTRHIKEFLKQQGFKADTSKQIMKDYGFKEVKKTDANLKKLNKKIKKLAGL